MDSVPHRSQTAAFRHWPTLLFGVELGPRLNEDDGDPTIVRATGHAQVRPHWIATPSLARQDDDRIRRTTALACALQTIETASEEHLAAQLVRLRVAGRTDGVHVRREELVARGGIHGSRAR